MSMCVFLLGPLGKVKPEVYISKPAECQPHVFVLTPVCRDINKKKRCSKPSELPGRIKPCQINSFTLSFCPPSSRLMLTPPWSTWCPSWAAWTTAFTTHCCWRSEPWPTGTRLYLEAAGKTSTGWATPSLLLPDCWGGGWRTTRPWTAGQRAAEGSTSLHWSVMLASVLFTLWGLLKRLQYHWDHSNVDSWSKLRVKCKNCVILFHGGVNSARTEPLPGQWEFNLRSAGVPLEDS